MLPPHLITCQQLAGRNHERAVTSLYSVDLNGFFFYKVILLLSGFT